jgi:hypothetical protein
MNPDSVSGIPRVPGRRISQASSRLRLAHELVLVVVLVLVLDVCVRWQGIFAPARKQDTNLFELITKKGAGN